MMDRFNIWATTIVARIATLKDDAGQTFVEYSLVLVLVAVAVVTLAAFSGLAGAISGAMGNVTSAISGS